MNSIQNHTYLIERFISVSNWFTESFYSRLGGLFVITCNLYDDPEYNECNIHKNYPGIND